MRLYNKRKLKMATKTEEFTSEKNFLLPLRGSNIHIPKQLIEVNELLKSINNRLEDCALEWQAEVSRKQWKIINSKAIRRNLSEQSLLTRTYFSEKCLDETFQHLLTYNKLFSEYLNTFIDLLQDKLSNSTSDETENKMLNGDNTEPVHISTLKNKYLNKIQKFQNYTDDILTAQNSYIDVVSAKDNFDTKLLKFEAVLGKLASIPTNTLYQHWPNILRTTTPTKNKFGNTTVNEKSRIIIKAKYLNRANKLYKKKDVKKSSSLINNIGDQLLFRSHTKFC